METIAEMHQSRRNAINWLDFGYATQVVLIRPSKQELVKQYSVLSTHFGTPAE